MGAYIIDPFFQRGPAQNRIYRLISGLRNKRKLLLILFGVILILWWCVISCFHPQPPLKTINFSRLALNEARHVDAEIYVPVAFKEAEYYWRRTLQMWHRENQKFSIKRDFGKVLDLALKTEYLSKHAEKRAIQVRDSLKNVAQVEIILLQKKIDEFKATFKEMPLEKFSRSRFNKGELLILEAQAAFRRGAYQKCVSRLKIAEKLIGQSGKEVTEMLDSYLKIIPLWRQWVKETIDWSKSSHDVAIVIDKMNHVCQIYNNGELIKKYSVELGLNWIGHKQQRGDNATPEGKYFIRKKIPIGQSKYYKALAIDYPNQTDLNNFLAAKKNGHLLPNAQIGGSIELHGDGGKGVNWTQGCVALKNEDIDSLFKIVKIGTPVTIVGSINGNSYNNFNNLKSSK